MSKVFYIRFVLSSSSSSSSSSTSSSSSSSSSTEMKIHTNDLRKAN